jgi:TonB family protein
MYFDFGDGHPDLQRIPSALTPRETMLSAVVVHLLIVIAILVVPETEWMKAYVQEAEQARLAAVERQDQLQPERQQPFMFVQPQADMPALRPPPKAPPSDIDRDAMTRQRAPTPTNRQPFSRGNTSEFVEAAPPSPPERARGAGPQGPPSPAVADAGEQGTNGSPDAVRLPDLPSAPPAYAREGSGRPQPSGGGSLGEALRNLQRYAERAAFENPQGGDGAFGPSIQFDTKGVEFGPWIRRFIAQIKRNWFVPYAAMSLKGHVVLTFNVHTNGAISDLTVVGPSDVSAFNNAAFNALVASNPTQPLPAEYPSDKAFFTVTFYYNESPPAPSP